MRAHFSFVLGEILDLADALSHEAFYELGASRFLGAFLGEQVIYGHCGHAFSIARRCERGEFNKRAYE